MTFRRVLEDVVGAAKKAAPETRTCETCGHVGFAQPDGGCPNNNCPDHTAPKLTREPEVVDDGMETCPDCGHRFAGDGPCPNNNCPSRA